VLDTGEDLVFMLPNDVDDASNWQSRPVLLRASLKTSSFTAPTQHKDCHSSALTAADGKLFLLGGHTDHVEAPWGEPAADPSRMEVFEPHTGCGRLPAHPSGMGAS
jgi:hypothetical protein